MRLATDGSADSSQATRDRGGVNDEMRLCRPQRQDGIAEPIACAAGLTPKRAIRIMPKPLAVRVEPRRMSGREGSRPHLDDVGDRSRIVFRVVQSGDHRASPCESRCTRRYAMSASTELTWVNSVSAMGADATAQQKLAVPGCPDPFVRRSRAAQMGAGEPSSLRPETNVAVRCRPVYSGFHSVAPALPEVRPHRIGVTADLVDRCD